jgi:hypothetical protein
MSLDNRNTNFVDAHPLFKGQWTVLEMLRRVDIAFSFP